MSPVLIIGFGYIGQKVARAELARGSNVTALVRSERATLAAQELGVHVIPGDLDRSATLETLPTTAAIIYYFAPPPSDGVTEPRIRNFIQTLSHKGPPAAIVYISTTGVYGDSAGDWITEATPVNPSPDRSCRRLDAENALRQWADNHPSTRTIALRVAGIYGPAKLPIERVRRADPMVDAPESPSYINLIHTDDLVQICLAAAQRGRGGEVYNACDGHPVTMMAYLRTIAKYLDVPEPPVISWSEAEKKLSPGMLSYLKESRRISNEKARAQLGVNFRYPSMASGIAAIFNASP